MHGLIGDGASSLTPLRLGGEPVRAWAMRGAGVTATAAIVCVGVELLATSAVIVLAAIVLGFALAPEWWATVGPALVRAMVGRWPWIVAVAALTFVAWWLAHRLLPDSAKAVKREIAEARAHASELPLWVYAVNVPLTLANIATRVAILPVLVLTLPAPPPLDATVVGSFVLLYSQALIPTPAGAGAVELGFVAGAAGELGAEEAALLIAWRLYTTLFGIAVGLGLALYRYGWGVVPLTLRKPTAGPPDERP